MSRRKSFLACSAILCATSLAGCGGGGPAPASGVVKLDGMPVDNATVTFAPADPGAQGTANLAYCLSDSSGAFQLRTPNNVAGAFPGRYKVTVTKWVYPPDVKPPTTAAEGRKTINLRKEGMPADYTTFESTPLVVEVPKSGKTDIVLELSTNQ
jgi:hypothetical protein